MCTYMYLFKRLTPVSGDRFYRFEHIVSYSSGKVVGKVDETGGLINAPLYRAPARWDTKRIATR